MFTVNISLPKQLYEKMNQLIDEEGFASRSEFVRTLIRFYTAIKAKNGDFLEFQTIPLVEIKKKLLKEKKYSQKFVKSVLAGLAKSSVYANKTIKKRFD